MGVMLGEAGAERLSYQEVSGLLQRSPDAFGTGVAWADALADAICTGSDGTLDRGHTLLREFLIHCRIPCSSVEPTR